MPREDRWDYDVPWGRRADDRYRDDHREDFGQADYSDRYGYDPRTRSGYRLSDEGRRPGEERYWDDRREYRRARPSDQVLWAVIVERLRHERRLDLRDVEIEVYDGEVTLNGTVRRKGDKRRIEDVADVDGVRNVQNNLRLREDRRWTFL